MTSKLNIEMLLTRRYFDLDIDAASFPLEANGQTSWLIDQAFPGTDTSDFAGSVRCDAVGEGRFSAVALEMDPGTRIFTTLPVFPVPEMPSQE